jgi:hypothetical protein
MRPALIVFALLSLALPRRGHAASSRRPTATQAAKRRQLEMLEAAMSRERLRQQIEHNVGRGQRRLLADSARQR